MVDAQKSRVASGHIFLRVKECPGSSLAVRIYRSPACALFLLNNVKPGPKGLEPQQNVGDVNYNSGNRDKNISKDREGVNQLCKILRNEVSQTP